MILELKQMNSILDYMCIDWMNFFFLFQTSILVYPLNLVGGYALHYKNCVASSLHDSKQSKWKALCTGMKCLFVAYEESI